MNESNFEQHRYKRHKDWFGLVKKTVLVGGICSVAAATWKVSDHIKHDKHLEEMNKRQEYIYVMVKEPIDTTKTHILSESDFKILDSLLRLREQEK
jgi:hypothetical protein